VGRSILSGTWLRAVISTRCLPTTAPGSSFYTIRSVKPPLSSVMA
jgi:hypothetical protein